MFVSQKIKEMIVLLKIKKDLIHTIRSILQVFPEGVIIRSVDSITQKTVIKFANDVANKFLDIKLNEMSINENFNVKLEDKTSPILNQFQSLSEFLYEQELKIDTNRFTSCETITEIKESSRKIEEVKEFIKNLNDENEKEENPEIYHIKSIKVRWENNDSYLHVFVNTTQIKILEKEKASRECQQTMFTSLSHDMRTPLNSITNSFHLIGYTIEDMKKKIAKFEALENTCNPYYPKLEKYIKVGEISSYLLQNLVEDILDLAKFNANIFKLNIIQFKLGTLLNEINFLFAFQCNEKGLKFRIVCDVDLANANFESDLKRIKQVLINLISNSIKFTEKGGITLKVSKFEDNNKIFLEFKVKDTGVGINKDDFPKLFNKFSMLYKHMKLNACGSGIGLSISKMIVDSLGGQISVSSEEGAWTEFKFNVECLNDNKRFCKEELKQSKNEEVQFLKIFL